MTIVTTDCKAFAAEEEGIPVLEDRKGQYFIWRHKKYYVSDFDSEKHFYDRLRQLQTILVMRGAPLGATFHNDTVSIFKEVS